MTPEPKPGDIVGVRVANRTHHNPNWVWCSETFPGGVGFFGAPRSALVPLPPEITPTAQAVVTAAMEEQEAHKLLVPRAERYMLPRESWTPTAKALWRACEAHAKTLPKPDPKRGAAPPAAGGGEAAAGPGPGARPPRPGRGRPGGGRARKQQSLRYRNQWTA